MNDAEATALGITVMLIFLALFMVPAIFYLLSLQKTFKAIRPENRLMEPGQVWLMFIPLFNYVWHFIIVNRMADSLAAEFRDRGIDVDEERPGIGVGLAMCICACCGIIPLINYLTGIATLVLWIIYWVKISGYQKMLLAASQQPNEFDPQGQF